MLFESSRDALMTLAPPSWKFTGANLATLELFGASSVAEFTALGPWEVSPERQPDGRPSSEKAQEMIATAMREGSHFFEWEHQRLGGQPFAADVLLTRMKVGENIFLQATVRDITERKQAEDQLRLTAQRLSLATESARIGIWDLDLKKNTLLWDERMYELYGIRPEDFGGAYEAWEKGVHPDDLVTARAEVQDAIAGAKAFHTQFRVVWPDGQVRHIEAHALVQRGPDGTPQRMIGVNWDITERKRYEAELRESEEKNRLLFESSRDALMTLAPPSWKFTGANQATLQLFGASSVAEFTALGPWEVSPERQPDGRHSSEKAQEMIATAMREGSHFFEWEHQRLDGQPFAADVLLTRMEVGEELFLQATVRDISERKQVEAALRESEERFASAFHTSPAAITITRVADGKFLDANQAFLDLFEFNRDEVIGHTSVELNMLSVAGRSQLIRKQLETGGLRDAELLARSKSGRSVHLLFSSKPMELAGETHHVTTLIDITARKQAEAAIQHANRALATLSAVNRNLVHASDENELLQAICDAIVEQKGYRLAWVGYVQHDESKSIRIMARAGHDEGYLDAMQLTWAEAGRGMGPSGRAIRSGATQLCQDIASDPLFLPWRDAALQRGYAASIALPLLNGDGTVFGILHVYSAVVNDFTPGEVALLEEMAGDLAFGVLTLHTRQERDLALEQNQRHLEELRNSLEDTVRAMAGLVEMRDPYTAGHQVRVADLSAAIAKQMALSEEQIHAIHLAGIVHDLGKINVPAEILSKPGNISDIEFDLIKTHAQAGYEILKDINFPWPIAQMVLQHHERMDGSGYPQGLKGEAILLEARILSVADTVEAMSSHRPYRPSLGIEVALAEITKQRGRHYDPQVVDACLCVIKEKGFVFK